MNEVKKKESAANIQIFENQEFEKVRTVLIDGEPWFVGKDVAEILGYKETAKAIREHVDEDDKLNSKTLLSLKFDNGISSGLNLGQRGWWLINESEFTKSKLGGHDVPYASESFYYCLNSYKVRPFKRWITMEF